jgi:2-keto-myo-inositol isomerase
MTRCLSRRAFLVRTAALGAAAGAGPAFSSCAAAADAPAAGAEPFRFGLNTGTLRGSKLALPELVEIAATSGYRGIEPWIDEIQKVASAGEGALSDLAKRIRDVGLVVESAIGFPEWIVDDDARRAKGMEAAKRDMDLVLKIGGTRIAAPPAGAYDAAVERPRIVERYRAFLELGERMGVAPQLEFWGSSKTLNRLEECVEIAAATKHPLAGVIPDVFHMYKGGSDFAAISKRGGVPIHVFHMNDYPADPPREKIGDGQRVYPGDGIAPLGPLFKDLKVVGFRGVLSLELFNKEYLKAGAAAVAKAGLEKMRAAVRKGLAE